MERRRGAKRYAVMQIWVLAAAAGFILALATPIHVEAAGRASGCPLGLLCTPTPTAAAAPSPTPTPSSLVSTAVGKVTGTVKGATGTVTGTVTGVENTLNGLLGSRGGPTLLPTPCVVGCATATPAPPSSGTSSGSGTTSATGSTGPGTSSGSGTQGSSSAAVKSPALHGQLAAQSVDLATPPSVLGFGPIPGIDFGNAPFLWPLFLALDVVAFCAVLYVIRKKGFAARE